MDSSQNIPSSLSLNSTINKETSALLRQDSQADHRLLYLSQKKFVEDLDQILNHKISDDYHSIHIDLTDLKTYNSNLYSRLFVFPSKEFLKWNVAAKAALQLHIKARDYMLEPEASLKNFINVRFFNNPSTEKKFPKYRRGGELLQVRGIVQSISTRRYVEYGRELICTNAKCDEMCVSSSCFNKNFVFELPTECHKCLSKLKIRPEVPFKRYAHFFQEILLEEESKTENYKQNLKVTLDDDLTDTLELGDPIFVVGTVESRMKPAYENMEPKAEFVLKANSAKQVLNKVSKSLNEEDRFLVEDDWCDLLKRKGEFGARDALVASFEPNVYGMNLSKFLVLTALASCVQSKKYREQSHILLIGATGIAKSHLLLKASELIPKSYFGGCYRVTTAGLTVGISSVEGQKTYEMGILPKCDGGVCCLDEFNNLTENDKASIHESMEQQTIHIRKAGILAKLNTRCAIFAACNPGSMQTFQKNDESEPIFFKMQPSLLSRFDVVFVLRDYRNDEFHRKIVTHVGNKSLNVDISSSDLYSTEMLKRHLLAAKDVEPQMNENAIKILKRYYNYVQHNPYVDPCRNTLRCLNALYRLSKAYARLLLKPEVTELDAVVIIYLIMENSYSMNENVNGENLVEKSLPLGPTEQECKDLLKKLGLEAFGKKVIEQLRAAKRPQNIQGTQFKVPATAAPVKSDFFKVPGVLERPCSSKSLPKNDILDDPLKKFTEEIEADMLRLSQKLKPAPMTSSQSFPEPPGEDKMDFLDELELLLQDEGDGEPDKSPLEQTESPENDENLALDINIEPSIKEKISQDTKTASPEPVFAVGSSFKDILKQFSYSQTSKKRPQNSVETEISPKKQKTESRLREITLSNYFSKTVKQSVPVNVKPKDDFDDFPFDNILDDVRSSFFEPSSESTQKSPAKKLDLSGVIDESIFDDDFE